MKKLFFAVLFAAVGASAEVKVDNAIPAGNIAFEKIEGDTVYVHQELRDTKRDWFYWKMRVCGAAGRRLVFKFTTSPAVGARGAAVSFDHGRTWEWSDLLQPAKLDPKTKDHASASEFAWQFADDADEVWFCQTIPYDQWNWEEFIARHEKDRGKLFETGVLCKTRKGRDIEYARFGRLDGKAKYRAFVTSRHHCGETTATYTLEGILECVFADDALGGWLRENVEIRTVPFVDKDGVVDGDQGKGRFPHDHARDYNEQREAIYPEVAAIKAMLKEWKPHIVNDCHCPWLRGSWMEKNNSNEFFYQVGLQDPKGWSRQRKFSAILERCQKSGVNYRQCDDYWYGRGWNSGSNWTQGSPLLRWANMTLPSVKFSTSFEIPFANVRFKTLHPAIFRALGRDIATAWREYLAEEELPYCVDGIYPHLAYSNNEDECGTGAVVPFADRLWAITYGPHCPLRSSDKLYEITKDLRQIVREESVGGTHANRMIHKPTNQLLIGPYAIDTKRNVRTVPRAKMPGRLTGCADHLSDPDKVYVATMETGLYELNMKTLSVNTLIREEGMNDDAIGKYLKAKKLSWPTGWEMAPRTHIPGYHSKGLASGFGRVFISNNGENSKDAKKNPFIPSGVLAWWNQPGEDWQMIRRCQFTEVKKLDGGIVALGWDAKSVLLAITTDGEKWQYYRLPKASHCYDGAHGWNTEWPRIREAGLGGDDLLATMHGTFWRFPKAFSPANPNGIRPISTYLKVIGDFCYWKDAPNGGSIVFGCDDHARSEFLGKRKLKANQPKRERSVSNLWFVKPEDIGKFGPPSGEGWVWLDEDVKKGELSDPFLYAGYENMEFCCTDGQKRPAMAELVREGDWVRVKALEDIKGANAHFMYGPAKVKTPTLAGDAIEITDDNGKTWKFPNVNGDKTVVCREVATERDLLYVGGVFYEVPAENAGGFAVLRPIALADEPVTSISADYGLVFINGKPMALDTLWQNGSAAKAYWLWRETWAK